MPLTFSKGFVIFRGYSTKKSSFYVTTPIYYVNATPHIGHLYSSVIADAIKRWQQLLNPGVLIKFATGTDEHGTKIQQAALANNTPLQDYCSKISEKYQTLADKFSIDYTDFVRTTSSNHKTAVEQFWKTIKENGYIYSAKYSGWYCVSDETFLTESQLKEIVSGGKKVMVSSESGHPVEWTEEENYMFRLSSFQNELIYWLKNNDNSVKPAKFRKILLDTLSDDEMPDVSISRPCARVHWGIKVPEDNTQTIYVWLDALVNYLTAAGYPRDEFRKYWPPDVQVIGKDILKFHGIYWPAFLMAAKLEPPSSILCHSHWTVDGEKMSKSKKNVVCPLERSAVYKTDGFRYFLLREGVAHSDGNYSDTKAIRILNSELADTLGNLLSRCCGKALNPHQLFPGINKVALDNITSLDATRILIGNLKSLPQTCEQHYNDFNFHKAVVCVMDTLRSANVFFETLRPWELRKDPKGMDELNAVLHVTMEALRISAIALQPVIPNLSNALLAKIGVPDSARTWESATRLSWDDSSFQPAKLSTGRAILFERIHLEDDKKRRKAQG